MWVGALHGGLNLFDPDGTLLGNWGVRPGETHHLVGDETSILKYWVSALLLDSQGRLYIGYDDGGFSIYLPEREHFTHFDGDGIHVLGTVTRFLEDGRGLVWIATRMGLTRFDPATQAMDTYTIHDGLPSASVRSLEMDSAGKLWLGTSAGLVNFDPNRRSFRVYDIRDGLEDNEFLTGSCISSDGTMYFSSSTGITSFNPERFEDNTFAPPVVLTGVSLFNTPVEPGPESILGTTPSLAESIVLNPEMDVVGFEFAALNYLGADKNRYQYRLEGLENEWNEVGSDRRFATYTDLHPEQYVFRVRGSNNDGLWSDKEVSLTVTVLPDWWETSWFKATLVLGLVCATYGGVRLRINILQRQKQRLEHQVAERTEELAQANKKLENLAKVDGLTQVANRRSLDAFLAQEWQRLAREERVLSVILLDIDYFKKFNDMYGHQVGDECLKDVAQAITRVVRRPSDLVARYGGEEFAVIMPETDTEGAKHVAEQIRREVAALKIEHRNSQASDTVSVSLGVATCAPDVDTTPKILVHLADQALYQAKQAGRDRVVVSEE
ncbi:MAG: diguanylate cyclase [Desulfovibrio sp.]|nr:MAG: diguanylate cyclase [Desulfovibrio sp.]